MKKKYISRIATTVVALSILNIYFGLHIQQLLQNITTTKWIVTFWIIFELVAIPLIVSVIPMPSATATIRRALKVTAHSILGFSIILLYWFIVYDAIFLFLSLTHLEITREFATIYGMIALIGSSFIYVIGLRNAMIPKVTKYAVKVNKNIVGSEKMKIVMLSDLHLGNIVGNKQLDRMVKIVNKMDADLIFFIGDTLDDSIEPFIRNDMGKAFGKLNAKIGKYAVLGNHDYYGNCVEIFCSEMEKSGVSVLQDEVIKVAQDIVLVGRKDKVVEEITVEGRKELNDLISGVEKSSLIMLMDHQPYEFDQVEKMGIDLSFYGHTHRGQMAPYHLLTGRRFELDWGYLKKGDSHIVVSSGFGIWGPPIRLKSRSEIVEIDVMLKS